MTLKPLSSCVGSIRDRYSTACKRTPGHRATPATKARAREIIEKGRGPPNVGIGAYSTEVVALAQLGQIEEGRQVLEPARATKHNFDLNFVANTIKQTRAMGYEFDLDGLKKAVLEEGATPARSWRRESPLWVNLSRQ